MASKSGSTRTRKSRAAKKSRVSRRKSSPARSTRRTSPKLSAATKKRIDSLPEHAKHIYEKAHASALREYKNPSKRRGGKSQSSEQVAHKVAWAAVKNEYQKKGDEWVKR
ncbi:MAG: ChaB family protein [Nitrososphaera sp.]|jgi:cation transport regulator